ncbi:MAG: hypothetical protein ACRBN8_35380 [Nannocystales bacterium]
MPYDMTTILKDRSARLCLLSALTLLGTACGDDVTPTGSGSTGDESSTTASTNPVTSTTSTTATTVTPTTDATTDESTTSGGTDTSSTTDQDTDTDTDPTDPTGGSTTMVDPTKGDTTSTTGDESTSEGATTTGGETMGECPYGELMAPDVLNTTTLGEDSEFTNSCGGGGAPDVSYTLTAPADGTYFFTATSPDGVVDPLVAVYDGTCGGPELACNEDIDGGTTAARVSASLVSGQTVTVVLDGFALAGGAIDLEVAFFEGSCPDGDAGNTVPQVISASTVGGDNTTFASCGGATGNDDQYTFTAPEAGVYTFDTLGSDFDTLLYILDGCGGTELGCNDDSTGSTSRINLTMAQDQDVVVVVDGAGLEEGNYDLNINFDECPDFDLGQSLPITVTGNTEFETDASSGSCGPGDSNDVAYTFTAPQAGNYVFDTNGSNFDTVLYYYDGATCVGAEVECDDDDGDGVDSLLTINMVEDQQVTLIVDGRFGGFGDYVLNVTLPECGNDLVELGEECDGAIIPDTCFSLGMGGGAIACDPVTCQYDTAACGDDCGNGTLDAGEVCDLSEFGGATCQSEGFAGGPLGCGADCTTVDSSECSDDIVVVCSTPAAAIDSALPPVMDTITIPDIGTIADVDLYMDITHTYNADLDMSLSADDLGLQNNLSLDNCGSIDDVLATFNDEGEFAVGSACIAPVGVEGNVMPEQPLSVYDGGASNGAWTLTVDDDAGGDIGTLNEWCLFITLE